MPITKDEIYHYLSEVKDAVRNNRYTIARNPNRQDNLDLFIDYVLDESDAKQILLSLETDDFSEIRQNDHVGYEYEKLYVFGKDIELTERFGNMRKRVSLYIKLNKLERKYVIVVSFHEQKYPLIYYFK